MGAIKKMIEEEVSGVYVLSLMIGKNVIKVPSYVFQVLEEYVNNLRIRKRM